MITKNEQKLLMEMFIEARKKYPKKPWIRVFTMSELLSLGVFKRKESLSIAVKNLEEHDFISKRRIDHVVIPYYKRKKMVKQFIQQAKEWNEMMKRLEERDADDWVAKTLKETELEVESVPLEHFKKNLLKASKKMEKQRRDYIKKGLSKKHVIIHLNENGVDLAIKLTQYEFGKSPEGKAFQKFIESCA